MNKLALFQLIAFCIMFVFEGCKKADNPVACFKSNLSVAQVNQTILLTNCSTGGNTYLWNFGDGATAAATDVTHSYGTPGTYTVTLTITNREGSFTSTAFVTITGTAGVPFACIQASALYVHAGDTVTFESCSNNATGYMWDFGDSTFATTEVTKHVFSRPSTVILKAINAAGYDTATVDVGFIPPTRDDFVGHYSGHSSCVVNSGGFPDGGYITANPQKPNEILIYNLTGIYGNTIAIVNGFNIVIPPQTVNGCIVSGDGSINLDFTKISYSITRLYSGINSHCTGVLTLQK
ncbi:MAG TPA: PKD domain-containing protein [Chitinophagales bacterium]|nr:PKD domain-containing protein [Chitinophagales bacterium]